MVDLAEKVKSIRHERERQFAMAFFDHDEWEYEPVSFPLPYGMTYTPDFFDAKRDVYIELVGTKQAFAQNKHKYLMMEDKHPAVVLEFRSTKGEKINPFVCQERKEREISGEFGEAVAILKEHIGTHSDVARALGITPFAYRNARAKHPSSLMWFAVCSAALLIENNIELPFRGTGDAA